MKHKKVPKKPRPKLHEVDRNSGDEMETRIARLESRVDYIFDTVSDIKSDVREIRNWGIGAVAFILVAIAGSYILTSEKMDARFEKIDARFEKMDSRFDDIQKMIYELSAGKNAPQAQTTQK